MAVIPPFFLDCVVGIGYADEGGRVNCPATGFLYARRRAGHGPAGEAVFGLYLVTNRQALAGRDRAFLRFSAIQGGGEQVVAVDLAGAEGPLWTAHPDVRVDVAVLGLDVRWLQSRGVQYASFIEDRHVMGLTRCCAQRIGEGDGVFVLGFPQGDAGAARDAVVVRSGTIARIRDFYAGRTAEFLVDSTVFPGNRGGPVVNRPEPTPPSGTRPPAGAQLVGMVSGFVPYRGVAGGAGGETVAWPAGENTGLAVVVSAQAVMEAIEYAETRRG